MVVSFDRANEPGHTMLTFTPGDASQGGDRPPRCRGCSYLLERLEEPRCPECGRPFDPADPATFTRLPGFLFWKYWMPGVALAAVAGLASFAVFIAAGATGWAFTLATPVMIGALIGYGVRARWLAAATAALPVLGAIIMATVFARIEGTFCGAILGAIAIVPLLFGAVCGIVLRMTLKNTTFSQRWYLPVLLFLSLPPLTYLAQRTFGGPVAVEQQSTVATVAAPAHVAWKRRLFAEGVPAADGGPYRVGLVHPVAAGGSTAAGGTFVARFTKGATAVRITRRVEDRELDWTFVTQDHIEDLAIRLLDGRMTFDAVGPTDTRVTVSTRYQPLMTPRWCWRPIERWAGDATHRQVLTAMGAQ